MMSLKPSLLAIAAAALASCPAATQADPIADFYSGKQLRIIIRAAPGGSYDTYSRFLGRHIGRFLPGNPVSVPVNMPGGSGLKALGYVETVAPKDGTVFTMVSQSFPMDQALHLNKSLDIDLRKLNWIGNMSEQNQVLYTAPISPTHTLEDAKRRETVIGATSINATSTQLIALYNNALGTKFKIIYGYPGGAEIALAVERGELEGRNSTTPPTPFANAGDKPTEFHFIIQTGLKKHPVYPDVPLLTDLATNTDERAAFDLITKASAVSRPFAAASGVPRERVDALRRAFTESMNDPQFLEEAKRQDFEIALTAGEDLQKIIADIISAPPATLERMKMLMVVHSAEAAKGIKPGPAVE